MEKKIPTKLPMMRRAMTIALDPDSLSSRAEGDDRIPVALSSEAPVERWFGTEILDHTKSAVDLSRAKGGLPLLLDHDTREHVGLIEDVHLAADKVVRGMARFSRGARGQEVRQDVLDGIRTNTSVGYRIMELVLEKSDKKTGDTYRATKWQPMEGSLVAIPADITVGVGRSSDQDELPVVIRNLETASEARSETVETPAVAPSGAVTAGADRSAEAQRSQELAELASLMQRDADLGGWIRSGKSYEAIKTDLMAEANRALEQIRTPAVDLTEKQKKEYSLVRAVAAEIRKDWRGAEFEREVSDAIEKSLPSGYQRRGNFFMPGNIGTRTALSTDGAGSGAETVFTEAGSFIELLRKRMKVRELGATMLSGLRGPVAFPKQSGAGTLEWLGESATQTESNLSTAQVALNPKTARAKQSYTKQLFLEGVVDAENLIRNDLALIGALGIDLAAINGSGAANEPLGILNTSGIGSVAMGTHGDAPTYAKIVDLETEIAADNADIGTMAYLTTAQMRGKLKKTETFATTNGQPVWTGGREGEMNGYAAHVSNQVPSTLVKGNNSDCHAIIFGVWSQLMIGEWGVLEIQVDPYTRADYGEVVLRTFQMVGVAVRYAEAFAAIKDARNT
jgi:HK97 family phage major capsid protein